MILTKMSGLVLSVVAVRLMINGVVDAGMEGLVTAGLAEVS